LKLVTTIDISPQEQAVIAEIIGCTSADLNTKLNAYVAASIEEYLAMIQGQRAYKRGSDILEYRLFLLMKHVFNGTIPDERTVCRLFQTSITGSRSLIGSVLSKYQYQIRIYAKTTMQNTLHSATRTNPFDSYTAVIKSQNIVEELNKLLADIDGRLTPITKMRGSISTYEIAASSYNDLCTRLNVQPNP